MNKIIIGLVALSVSFGSAVNAQQTKGGQGLGLKVTGVEVSSAPVQAQVKEKAQIHEPGTGLGTPVKTQVGEANKGVKTEIKNVIRVGQEKAAEVKNEIKNKLMLGKTVSSEAVKATVQKMQEEKEAFRVRVEASKEEVKTKREQEKEALKARLQAVKNEAKKAAVQRLDESMNKINSNFVERSANNLTKFDDYLAKLVANAGAVSDDKDLTDFNSAVESAKMAMAAARTSIEVQAQRSYAIAVSTEENLRSDVSVAKEALNSDLKSVKNSIQEAHSALVKTLTEFNKIK